jgi:beta-glucosidase
LQNKENFLWGSATSSYQVEGGITNNDWDFFTSSDSIKRRISDLTKPSIFYRGTHQIFLQPAGDAARSWGFDYYEKDFELARCLGMNAYRIGIEWSRLEPKKNIWDDGALLHYKQMIQTIRDKGLTPIVTLNHLTLPLWVSTPPSKFKKRLWQNILPSPLKDIPFSNPVANDPYWNSLRGWENEETIEHFIKYVSKVVSELKHEVDYWITLGEPVASVAAGGYLSGLFPPGFFLDGDRTKKVLHNLIEAHIQAYNKITEIDDIDCDSDGYPKRVGFAHLMMAVSPAKSNKINISTDNDRAAKNFDYFINDYFLNAVIDGEEDLNYLNNLQRKNKNSKDFFLHNDWKDKIDFIGVDYYRRVYVYKSKIVSLSSAKFVGGAFISDLKTENDQPHDILNDLGWEIYPEGLYHHIMKIKKQWNKPILITENGIADKSDKYRAQFIVSHLRQVRRAIDNGANIIGYLYWSFMDNYEWQEGFRPEGKFGLFRINYHEHNLIRNPTNGAQAFKFIIRESLKQNKSGLVSESAIAKAEEIFGSFSDDGTFVTIPKSSRSQ